MEVFENREVKFKLFLSRTGFGRMRLVTKGTIGWLCKSIPSQNGIDAKERLGESWNTWD